MASRRCGCASDQCSCTVVGGAGIDVTGTGTANNPYLVESQDAAVALSVQDDNTTILSGVNVIDFQGAGVTVTAPDATGEVVVAIPGDPGGGIAVEDEGTQLLASAARLNFVGAGVSAADAGSGEITVTVPGATAATVPKMAAGFTTVTIPVGQSRANVAITFPVGRFTAIPRAVASNAGMTSFGSFYAGTDNTTMTGMNVHVIHRDGTTVSGSPAPIPVNWIAIQE
jgi:hypothetical protein